MKFEVAMQSPILTAPMKVVVIIPAAGLGTRMTTARRGKKVPSKQFTELAGTPILLHTLRKFAASPEVAEIFVALRKDEINSFRTRLEKEGKDILQKNIQLVEGGEHRQQSVANALAAVKAAVDDIILVHDAVRPFVTAEIIQEVVQGVKSMAPPIAGLPAVDTIKQVERTADAAIIKATVPREKIVMHRRLRVFATM